ncbi:Gm550 [Phodopus roborovskii]|uniref:Gm550 protein n=1 Tax=Phodopus roborovskii TaxID=109678 RepID=A0AAU9ZLG6_PHORO|nr:Gm550 [Phodopus roborovskii]
MQPAEPQIEEPEDSREPSMETSSEQNLNLQSEPTVTFLFTLLNTPEPKDAESDTETLEHRFLGQEDWGPKRTSAEIQNLQRDCKRLQEALNTNQRNNLDLEERLQNLVRPQPQSHAFALAPPCPQPRSRGHPGEGRGHPGESTGHPGESTGHPGESTGRPGGSTGRPGGSRGHPEGSHGSQADEEGFYPALLP